MKRLLLLATFAWFVVNTSGHAVAGPFTLLSDCNAVAGVMAAQDARIMSLCRSL